MPSGRIVFSIVANTCSYMIIVEHILVTCMLKAVNDVLYQKDYNVQVEYIGTLILEKKATNDCSCDHRIRVAQMTNKTTVNIPEILK